MTRVAITGANGRMGLALLQALSEAVDITLGAATVRAGSPLVNQPVNRLLAIDSAVVLSADLRACAADFDVVIDFTRPESSMETLAMCCEQQKSLVLGTTGFSDIEKQTIQRAAQDIPIVFAPNMSVGVNLTLKLLQLAAATLGDEYDVEIIEAHHRHKVDAPSGTALRMGEVIAESLGRNLADCAIYGREGHTGPRQQQTIGFATVRAGDIVGEHTVLFATTGERVEIGHRASSRLTFAKGALRAAHWLSGRSAGLYDMQDVLALH